MPKSQLVAQHVPYLRRYARALTGSQASGDAYVTASLEALIKEPNLLPKDRRPRVALFRLFSAIWNSVPVNASADRQIEVLRIDQLLYLREDDEAFHR